MKICFLTHNLREDNGGGVLSRRLVEGLRDALGAEVVVLTTQGSQLPYELPILYPERRKLFRELFRIRKIVKSADIIHALDGFPYGLMAVLASLGLKKKIIITAVGSGAIIPLYKTGYRFLMSYAYRKAKSIIAISHFTKQEILKRVPDLMIQVITPGVDYENITALNQGELPEELAHYRPYIVSVGSLRWRKGYKLSIPAFAEVLKKIPNLSYLIVGKKYTEKEYQKITAVIDQYNLKEKVKILDTVDDPSLLYRIYKHAELFCLLSQNKGHDVEGFGIVFLEAAANGLPVVGSKDCGVEDAMREGENGYLVNSTDIHGFARRIVNIVSDQHLKTEMSETSLRLAKSETWAKKISEYARVYKTLT
jgi:phosphatidylinositol alpha-1,6-mannosyltransferase